MQRTPLVRIQFGHRREGIRLGRRIEHSAERLHSFGIRLE